MKKQGLCMLLTVLLVFAAAFAAAEGTTPALQGAEERTAAPDMTLGQTTLGEMSTEDKATQEQWFKSVSADANAFYALTLENLGSSGYGPGIPFGLYGADGEELHMESVKSGNAKTVYAKYAEGETIYARVWGSDRKCVEGKYRLTLHAVPDAEADLATAAGEIVSGAVCSIDANIDQDVFTHTTGELPEYMALSLSNVGVSGELIVTVHDPDGMQLEKLRTYNPNAQKETILRLKPNACYVFTVFSSGNTGNYRLDMETTQDQHGDVIDAAQRLAVPAEITARIDGPDDVDYFAFEVKQADEIHVFTYTNMGVKWQLPIVVQDAYGQKLAEGKTPREEGSTTLYFKAETPGTYYLQLTDSSDAYGAYRLQYDMMADAHGDTPEAAAPITDGVSAEGQIDFALDVDCFVLEAAQAERQVGLRFECSETKKWPTFTVTDELGSKIGSLKMKKAQGTLVVTQPAGKKLFLSVTAEDKVKYAFVTCTEATHQFSGKPEITVKPTCKALGEQVDHCVICGGAAPAEQIAPIAHTPGKWETVTKAGCTADGLRIQRCSGCGDELEREETAAFGHVKQEPVVTREATCASPGEKKTKCAVCGETLSVEVLPATGAHAMAWQVEIAVACETDGVQALVCSVCGQVTERQRIACVGHIAPANYTVAQAAGCETDGLAVRTCTVCGEDVEQAVIQAAGHKLGTETLQINEALYQQCSVCEQLLPYTP